MAYINFYLNIQTILWNNYTLNIYIIYRYTLHTRNELPAINTYIHRRAIDAWTQLHDKNPRPIWHPEAGSRRTYKTHALPDIISHCGNPRTPTNIRLTNNSLTINESLIGARASGSVIILGRWVYLGWPTLCCPLDIFCVTAQRYTIHCPTNYNTWLLVRVRDDARTNWHRKSWLIYCPTKYCMTLM